MQKLIVALVILGILAVVYQGIALSSREAAEPAGDAATAAAGERPPR